MGGKSFFISMVIIFTVQTLLTAETVKFSGLNGVTGGSLELDSVHVVDLYGGREVMLRGETELDLDWFVPVNEKEVLGITKFEATRNYPNSFKESTRFKVLLPRRGELKLDLYNILGQRVAHLRERLESGEHEYEFRGLGVGAGVYLLRARGPGGGSSYLKMVKLGGSKGGRSSLRRIGSRVSGPSGLNRSAGRSYSFVGHAVENITYIRDTVVWEGGLRGGEIVFEFEPDKKTWVREYEGNYCTGVLEHPDGGYAALGYEAPNKVLLYRLDSYGYVSWKKNYELGLNTAGVYLDRLEDGGYFIVGSITEENEEGNAETGIMVMRTDSLGRRVFLKNLGREEGLEGYGDDNEHLIAYGVCRNGRGNYMVTGRIKYKKEEIEWDLLVMEVSPLGEVQWQRIYCRDGETAEDQYLQQGRSIVETHGGDGYLVLYDEHLEGMTEREMLDWDARVKKIGLNGEEEWDHGYKTSDIRYLRNLGVSDKDAERGLSIRRGRSDEYGYYYILLNAYVWDEGNWDLTALFMIDEAGVPQDKRLSMGLEHGGRNDGKGYGGNFQLLDDKNQFAINYNCPYGSTITICSTYIWYYRTEEEVILYKGLSLPDYFWRGWYNRVYSGGSALRATSDGGYLCAMYCEKGYYQPTSMFVIKFSGDKSNIEK